MKSTTIHIDNLKVKPLYEKQSLCTWAKYIAALLVVNGHLFIFHSNNPEVASFMNLGACCVSFFFFMSAYGLMLNFSKKSFGYLSGFFRKRIVKIIIPLLIAYCITLPVYSLLVGPVNWKEVLITITWGGPYLKYSWYVTEIIIVYLLFYLSMKFGRNEKGRVIWLTISIVGLMLLLFITKQPTWYIISLPGFILGIWYQKYEKHIISYINSKSYNWLLLSICSVGILWYIFWQWSSTFGVFLHQFRYLYVSYYLYNIFFVFFSISLILIYRFTPPGFALITSFYEVYLIQNCGVIISRSLSNNYLYFYILTFLITISIGYVQYLIDKKVQNLLLK